MLLIRSAQIKTLARPVLRKGLLAHARAVAPDVCASITSKQLVTIINYCIDRCSRYGITRDYDVARYLNLMLVFGPAFDEREDWAVETLAGPNPATRMEVLVERALIEAARPEHARA